MQTAAAAADLPTRKKESMPERIPHVVIVGGGFGVLSSAPIWMSVIDVIRERFPHPSKTAWCA